jgi:hypothetical protein
MCPDQEAGYLGFLSCAAAGHCHGALVGPAGADTRACVGVKQVLLPQHPGFTACCVVRVCTPVRVLMRGSPAGLCA